MRRAVVMVAWLASGCVDGSTIPERKFVAVGPGTVTEFRAHHTVKDGERVYFYNAADQQVGVCQLCNVYPAADNPNPPVPMRKGEAHH